jgi:hypothetical protein
MELIETRSTAKEAISSAIAFTIAKGFPAPVANKVKFHGSFKLREAPFSVLSVNEREGVTLPFPNKKQPAFEFLD